ncbi:hypothetical protein FHT40_000766 [Mycolicibacterium sp. BK556]|uniref:hypothetical protein n=1 Tax=Mycolicibacterium sp. BK556 TaxID=2587125 RepID=UPI00183912C8|nr:hypothetical protein [Mycolicibacterium sp. BK556]MBB3601133.1 hypothetical protein [Mycolicibacterium sp. BK556]
MLTALTEAALTAVVVRFVGSCITVAEAGLGFADVRAAAGLCVRALEAEELLVALCPESSGAAAATAAPAPDAISKPAPIAKPNVAIRPARFLEVMLMLRSPPGWLVLWRVPVRR